MRMGFWTGALVILVLAAPVALGATEEEKRAAIDDGLAWLAGTQLSGGSYDGAWEYRTYGGSLDASGIVAATASAALAFIEEGYKPYDGSAYGAVVGKAVDFIFANAQQDYQHSWQTAPPSNNVYFGAVTGTYERSVYTTGLASAVVYALGKDDPTATITSTNAVLNGRSYKDVMQGITDWFTWGQDKDGGWRYFPQYDSRYSAPSDNSTAQWGALPYLYGEAWGIATPASVQAGLAQWTATVQNTVDPGTDWRDGGSGYDNDWRYVNMAKTGGMLLEFAVMDLGLGDQRVEDALYYMTSMEVFDHWNQGATTYPDQWYGGHLNNPYAMWAVFKALEYYMPLQSYGSGTYEGFLVGSGISTAPGGITIGFEGHELTSAAGDWYSHYSDLLVDWQNSDGSWNGYAYWGGALAAGWYINILNATGAPPPQEEPIPEPGTFALLGAGLLALAWMGRRRRAS